MKKQYNKPAICVIALAAGHQLMAASNTFSTGNGSQSQNGNMEATDDELIQESKGHDINLWED